MDVQCKDERSHMKDVIRKMHICVYRWNHINGRISMFCPMDSMSVYLML